MHRGLHQVTKKKLFSLTSLQFLQTTFLDEIEYYIKHFQPLIKQALGIQEWIGFIGVEKIEGMLL